MNVAVIAQKQTGRTTRSALIYSMVANSQEGQTTI
jgi:hypothetical protein